MKTLYLWIIVLVFIQLGIAWKFSVSGVIPNILLVVSLCLFLSGRKHDGWIVALIGGASLDLFGPGRLGAYTLSTLAVFSLLEFMTTRYVLEPPWWSRGFGVFLGILLWNLITAVLVGNFSFVLIALDAGVGGVMGVLILWILEYLPKEVVFHEHL